MVRKVLLVPVLSLCLSLFALSVLAATPYNIVVTNAADTGTGTLRAAITMANTNTAAVDNITFAIPFPGNTINLASALPMIIEPVVINGNNGGQFVQIVGVGPMAFNGLVLGYATTATQSFISNLSIVNCNTAILLQADNVVVYGCWLGTDWADNFSPNNTGIWDQGTGNTFGGSGPSFRNVISANQQFGIYLDGAVSTNVWGNYIGLNNAGNGPLGVQQIGITIGNSATGANIGGQLGNNGNVISSHTQGGIFIQGPGTTNITVAGNIIGLTSDQSTALPNGTGITLVNASGNTIGLTGVNNGNVIAGNATYGIHMYGSTNSTGNIVQNNLIGLNTSDSVFSNTTGVYLDSAMGNLIGGNRSAGENNVISGQHNSGDYGVRITSNGSGNTVSGNFIGLDIGGTFSVPNDVGVLVEGDYNLIGGANSGVMVGNVISGNNSNGLEILLATGNTIAGNFIGLNAAGLAAVGNAGRGIALSATTQTVVGGGGAALRNVVAGSGSFGIQLASSIGDRIVGNYLGCNAIGMATLLNIGDDLRADSSLGWPAASNWIEANFIAGEVGFTGASGNTLTGNFIGVLPDGSPATLPASSRNVTLWNGSEGNWIGLPNGQGNLIANATADALRISQATTVENRIYSNTITAFFLSGIDLIMSGNRYYSYPTITAADTVSGLVGVSGANATIEVFIAEGASGRGGSLSYVGSTTADGSGDWSLGLGGYSEGDYLCATATDVTGDTSEFSTNVLVLGPPTATPTITPTRTPLPTNTPSPTASPTRTPLPTSTPTSTISPTSTASPTASASPTATNTPPGTYTITPSITVTSTITQTATISPTPTISPTSTTSPTITPTPTESPVVSSTPTLTTTLTEAPTSTSTLTPEATQGYDVGGDTIAYPNPAQDTMRFIMNLESDTFVKIKIFNLGGEMVAELEQSFAAGLGWIMTWDCSDVAPGVYLAVILHDGKKMETKKIAITK